LCWVWFLAEMFLFKIQRTVLSKLWTNLTPTPMALTVTAIYFMLISHHLLIGADDDIHGCCSSSGPCE
jgi:hypothetical protein